jgi:transposase
MKKISEVLRQRYELKRSYRDIAQSLNISISTVSDYLSRSARAKIEWPLPGEMSEQELYDTLFLPASKPTDKRPLPDWENIQKEHRKKGVTLLLLWREYRDIHENGLSYSQFCNCFQAYKKTIEPVMRQVHKAGEKTFVDYAGQTVEWMDPATSEIHYAQIFVGALGASQFIFCEATKSQTLQDWISSHVRMWEYFGGVSEIVVPDNLLSGVTKAHRYDPDVNANYQHLSEHYGFAIVPARVVEPKDKAKVENAVGIVTRQILAPLRHITFTSIAEINIAIKKRLEQLNNQPFQKMKTSRRELFETIDKPALNALPPVRYYYEEWSKAKIHIDYHFVFRNHFYSVPYQYIQRPVEIRSTAKTVECFCGGKRISSHARSYIKYGYTTLKEHMPPHHRAHAEWGPERMKRWAKKIGINASEFIEQMLLSRPFPQQAYRACLGLLRLGERYGEDRLEKACAIGLTAGMSRFQQIESVLKNQLDKIEKFNGEEKNEIAIVEHENIRGANYYK